MDQVIQVKRRAFSVVPDDILTDARLGWASRVVLSWMLGRSPEFELRIWHVRKTFGLSEQQWLRARKEMQTAGYFQQERVHDLQGRIRWKQIVTDMPDAEPCPQNPGYGGPRHGDPIHGHPSHGEKGGKPTVSSTRRSKSNERKNMKGPPPLTGPDDELPQVYDGSEGGCRDALVWPCALAVSQRQAIGLLLSGVLLDDAQRLLDELAGMLTTNSIKTSPERWLRAVVARYKQGEFEPIAGISIAEGRKVVKERRLIPVRNIQPASAEVSRRYLDQIGEMLTGKSAT